MTVAGGVNAGNRARCVVNQPILSPCIGTCTLRPDSLCAGCWRHVDEIALWGSMSAEQRELLVEQVLPAREQELA